MLYRVDEDKIFIASNSGEALFSFARSEFTHIAYLCGDDVSQTIVVTAAKKATDVADVMANRRGNYRAYRVRDNGSTQLTDEYTNTATPLPDGSISYSNGSNLVVRSRSDRRAWKTGRFSWGPVAISCNRDASVIAMTKWKGDDRKLFTVQLQSGAAATSTFSYYSYVLNDADVYYALGSGIKRFSLVSGETEALLGKVVLQALLDLFGLSEPPRSIKPNVHFVTLFRGRLLTTVLLLRWSDFARLAHAVVSWTPGQTDIRIEFDVGRDGLIDGLASDGDTAVISYRLAVEGPQSARRTFAVGASAQWIDAGWHPAGVPWFPEHGFQFLPS